MNAKALLFNAVNEVVCQPVEVPTPQVGEVLIATAYSCISPGTELRCLAGQQPGAVPFPFVPGYSQSGTVIAAGRDTRLAVGTRVWSGGTSRVQGAHLMWGGHISHAVRAETDVIPLPTTVDLQGAALLQLAGIAYRGVRLSQARPHETVLVVGLGPIGQLSARLHALTGARVIAADLLPERITALDGLGITGVVIADGADLESNLRPHLPDGADIVVDATGVPAVLPRLIALAKDLPWDNTASVGPRFIVQGSYAADFYVPYQDAFMKEITFYVPRHNQRRDLDAVCDLLARGLLRTDGLITHQAVPTDAPAVYGDLRAGRGITTAFAWIAS